MGPRTAENLQAPGGGRLRNIAESRARLADLISRAYSGELAAALAYRGHWRSEREPAARSTIRRIEEEELRHRAHLGTMLAELQHSPRTARELRARAVGGTLGALCYISGRLAPLIGAGMLESVNVVEYEDAARLAEECGEFAWVRVFLQFAETEREHERYFKDAAREHPFGKLIFRGAPRASRAGVGVE